MVAASCPFRGSGSLRDQVRDSAAWDDRARLRKLAETAPLAEQSLQLLVALGERLQAGHGDADAGNFLTRVQQAHPTDFYANFMLANALACTNRNDEAVGYYRAAIAVRPDAAPAWYSFGDSLRQMGRLDEAIAALEQCIRLQPRHGWAHAALGSALRRQRRRPRRMRRSATSGSSCSTVPRVFDHKELACALQDKQQWDEAVAHYREAVKIPPRRGRDPLDLGMAFSTIPDHADEPIERLRKALSLDPELALVPCEPRTHADGPGPLG